jgi:hypothetical protein
MWTAVLCKAPDERSLLTVSSKLEIRPSPLSGRGVFASVALEPMVIATEYGGGPEWSSKDETEYERGAQKYVFRIGPFHVRVPGCSGSSRRRSYLEWDGARETGPVPTHRCGHIVNSSHPRLSPPNNFPNCVFAVCVDDLVLSTARPPRARVFVACARRIEAGEELLLDYHYMLAYDMGFGCGSETCLSCLSALVHYCNEVARPILRRKRLLPI